jgi:class 3 adenylate cyclase
MIMDNQGRVFVHSTLEEKGRVLEGKLDRLAVQAAGLMFQQAMRQGEPVLEAVLPITMKADGLKIGVARIGISQRELINSIRQQQLVFFWISVLFVVIGLLLSFGLANVLTWPIYILAVGMQEVAQGDLSQQVKIYYRDEIGRLTEVFNQMIMSLREKLHMEKYLSNAALKSIKQHRDISRLKLGGETKCVTALFSDVRGFTAMAEHMSPEEVVAVLNIYLNLQGKVVHQHHGAVDKFVGDAVMAIFEGAGQEIHAVQAAVEIQQHIQTLNWARARTGQQQMQVGIGVNSGTVIMGNMGSEEMMNYTVIGDTINVTARLSSVARPGQVIVSQRVAEAISQDAILGKLAPVTVKGKEKPLDIYEVLAMHGGHRQGMRRAVDVPVVYRLAGLDEAHHATVHNLGALGCLLEMPTPLGVGTTLCLDIVEWSINLRQTEAVVKHVHRQGSRYYVGVCFTNLAAQDKDRLVEWVHCTETEIVPPSLA